MTLNPTNATSPKRHARKSEKHPEMRLAAVINTLVVVELGPVEEQTGGFHFSTPSRKCEEIVALIYAEAYKPVNTYKHILNTSSPKGRQSCA